MEFDQIWHGPEKSVHGTRKQVFKFDLWYIITRLGVDYVQTRQWFDGTSEVFLYSGTNEHMLSLVHISMIYNCQWHLNFLGVKDFYTQSAPIWLNNGMFVHQMKYSTAAYA